MITGDVPEDVFERYWKAVESGDSPGAVAIAVELRDSGMSLPDVLDTLVAAGQAEVGRRWESNRWNVAQEHRATSVSEDVVAALAVGPPPQSDGRSVIVTCSDGEWHALPSRILSATLRHSGFDVTYLGASVPTRHLTQLLHDIGPDAVALSCALPTRLWHARRVIEESRSAGIPVAVGGRGFGPQGRWGLALGASSWARDARGAAAALDLPPFVEPAPELPVQDPAMDALRARRGALVEQCVTAIRDRRMPDVEAYDAQQWDRTTEDFGHILDFLAAARYVDDEVLFSDFVRWLDALLVARGVPSATLATGLDVVADVVRSEVPGAEHVVAILAAGRSVVGAAAG